jgi:hypothetical protein
LWLPSLFIFTLSHGKHRKNLINWIFIFFHFHHCRVTMLPTNRKWVKARVLPFNGQGVQQPLLTITWFLNLNECALLVFKLGRLCHLSLWTRKFLVYTLKLVRPCYFGS